MPALQVLQPLEFADETRPGSHACGALAPARHADPSGQPRQAAFDVAFANLLYVPSSQLRGRLLRASQ